MNRIPLIAACVGVLLQALPVSALSGEVQQIPLDRSDPRVKELLQLQSNPVFESTGNAIFPSDKFFATIHPRSTGFESADEEAEFLQDVGAKTVFTPNGFFTPYEAEDADLHCITAVPVGYPVGDAGGVDETAPYDAAPVEALDTEASRDSGEDFPVTLRFELAGQPCTLECDPAETSQCDTQMLSEIAERATIEQLGKE